MDKAPSSLLPTEHQAGSAAAPQPWAGSRSTGQPHGRAERAAERHCHARPAASKHCVEPAWCPCQWKLSRVICRHQSGHGVYLAVAGCDVVRGACLRGREQCCGHGPRGCRVPLAPS